MDDLTFQDELNQTVINLPRAALRFAQCIAYPALNVETYLARIDGLAEAACDFIDTTAPLAERVDALSEYLFYRMNFRGNRQDYNDPENSLLNRVLDRRTGIPITLSLLYISVAQRMGMNAYGVGLPGHFIVGLYEDGQEILVDPFNTGLRLSLADCSRLVRDSTGYQGAFQPKWITPCPPADLLSRMLTNLCNAYIQREDWRSAIPVIQHLLQIQPDTDWHLRDLGYLYLYNGSLRLSAQYLEEYLRRAPGAKDFENVRTSLQIVAGRLALWN
jgi:regulator of sirC expression with transglutaminase-like and TPR domain